MTKSSSAPSGVPSTAYTRDYYVNCCQGYEEFISYGGLYLPQRLRIPLELASVQAGMKVLDLGCGRGELLIHCAQQGATAWGIDYASEALNLALAALQNPTLAALAERIYLLQGSVLDLPMAANEIDLVFMLDVVEHLYPAELAHTLAEIGRVLKPGGRLIIHTMPNLWYYRWGYPVYRELQRLRGETLPADPRPAGPIAMSTSTNRRRSACTERSRPAAIAPVCGCKRPNPTATSATHWCAWA